MEGGWLKGNVLEAKSQLSRLVKDALAGEEVIIASNGQPIVRLVPVANKAPLRGWGKWKKFRPDLEATFSPEMDEQIAKSLEDKR